MLVLFGVVDGTNEDTFVPFETCQSEIYADGGKELSPASWAIFHVVEMAMQAIDEFAAIFIAFDAFTVERWMVWIKLALNEGDRYVVLHHFELR